MNAILIIMALLSVVQLPLCHFSLWYLIALVGRILFSLRIIGATINIKYSIILEGVAAGAMLLWNGLFNKDSMPWRRLIIFIIIGGLSAGLQVLDNIMYVYITDDDDDVD